MLVEDKSYTDVISYTFVIRSQDEESFFKQLTDFSEGRVEPLRVEEIYMPWPEEEV